MICISLLIVKISYAQQINIKIVDSLGVGIDLCYVKLYCDVPQRTLIDYKIVKNGTLSYQVANGCSRFTMVVSAANFNDYAQTWILSEVIGKTLQCVMVRANVKALTPVVITAKRGPVQVKGDTTFYKVRSFTDGTESKLSDVLRKLPGIEVNERSGEVRFKGKPIETVLLEGDNLFGANYTIGTRNINANLVTEVQAIENFSDNYVLKGLEKEEKVALNIKLGNAKMKVSGNTEIAVGTIGEARTGYDINGNLIGLKQAHKFFATLSYNNLGYNKSPNDYFGNNLSLEQIKDRKYSAQRFIADPGFSFLSDPSRANVNAQLFGNYNGIFKLAQKVTLKANVFYTTDAIKNQQQFNNEYYFNNDTLLNKDLTDAIKKPYGYKGDLNLRYAASAKALLEFTTTFSKENLRSNIVSVSNQIPRYQTELLSKNNFLKNLLTYTLRLNSQHALQLELRSVISGTNQDYDMAPSAYRRFIFDRDLQVSTYDKRYNQFGGTLYGVKGRQRYNFFLKAVHDDNQYVSSIVNKGITGQFVSFPNKVRYRLISLSHGGTFNMDAGRLKLLAGYAFTYLSQQREDIGMINQEKNSSFILEPNIRLKFVISKISSVTLNYSLQQRPNVERHLFSNQLLVNFRNVVNNNTSLDLIKTDYVSLNYSRVDLYNQFDNGASIGYQANNRDYLPLYRITDTLLYSTFNMQRVRNRSVDLYLYSSKYLPGIKSSVKLSLSHAINWYYNFLLAGQLRENTGKTTVASLFFKTIFKGSVNIENEFSYSISQAATGPGTDIVNKYLENNAKLIFKPTKRVRMFVVGDYYMPNLSSHKGFLFLDYNLALKAKKREMEFKLVARNILDTRNYTIFQVSDFSKSEFSTNLMPRNIYVQFSFQF